MDPVGSLIGAVLLGLGTVILYGAVKNRRVFGADGIIPQALSKGSVTNLAVTEAFPASSSLDPGVIGKRAVNLGPVRDAVAAIAVSDVALSKEIETKLFLLRADSSREDLTPLAQLLAIADGKGLTVSTSIIRGYVLEVTGESI